MQKLVEEGHEVYAICPKGEKFDSFSRYGIKAVAYEIQRSSLNPLKEIKAIYNIYRAIKPLKLDTLHTFTAKPNIYGTIAGKMAKVPTIINLVEGLGSFYIENTWKSIAVRTLIEKLYEIVFFVSNQVVFVNSDDPKYLQEKKVITVDKTTIIKSVGIDTNEFSPDNIKKEEIDALRVELGVEGKIIVLMAARAIWHKGIREFYEAAALLSKNKSVQFVLVGDVDEGNPSSADKTYLERGDVLWLGQRNDMLLLTAMSDIYVLPSYYREGIPRTLLEAASMAKPIITTDTVGCREVVSEGENGYLVPVKDAVRLAEKIEYLAVHPDKRKIMGENGRIRAIREFDIKRVVEQYMELYRKFEGNR